MWWKCDLQIATPGYEFTCPPGMDLVTADGRAQFAKLYMKALADRGIQVVALADHHGCKWLNEMRVAAREFDITVFPGVEITSGGGSDGVHLVAIGGLEQSEADIELLLNNACGFDEVNHHRFGPDGNPAPSPRSLGDLLDRLPEPWLVLAPHVLSENGIASGTSQKGGVRWKALHHDRIGALDVGEPSGTGDPEGFNAKFRSRSLDDFPCLTHLAFISTSDAYRMEDLGSRFTWIRMQRPSLEGLRQALLDYEARVLRDSDPQLQQFVDGDPNAIRHAWVDRVEIGGQSPIIGDPIVVELDPRLNVIIGGRGSGKSTVVAALRAMYASDADLPEAVKRDAADFVGTIFQNVQLKGGHRMAISQERQEARWNLEGGSVTQRGGVETPTEFSVRVISQKELYERVAGDSQDPSKASRNLLALVDESLGIDDLHASALTFDQAADSARAAWVTAVTAMRAARQEVSRASSVAAHIEELRKQASAFDSESAQGRRRSIDRALGQSTELADARARAAGLAADVESLIDGFREPSIAKNFGETASGGPEFEAEHATIQSATAQFAAAVAAALIAFRASIDESREREESGPIGIAARRAMEDAGSLRSELQELGLDAESYDDVQSQLRDAEAALAHLNGQELQIPALAADVATTWSELVALHETRRLKRLSLVEKVAERSGALRFDVSRLSDAMGWAADARRILSLRSDGFLDDVPAVARWLCDETVTDSERMDRFAEWRDALVSNDYANLSIDGPRQGWWSRLSGADDSMRLRLASEMPEDLVRMSFLQDGQNPDEPASWQPVSQGSPGQRSAAMLSFVLHHGDNPLVLDQPEDDLDSAWISRLIIRELRRSRWSRQLIVVTHNANIPVNGDAERVIVMENHDGTVRVRREDNGEEHAGPIEDARVRADIQQIMEGGVRAFVQRERRYHNELSTYRSALRGG